MKMTDHLSSQPGVPLPGRRMPRAPLRGGALPSGWPSLVLRMERRVILIPAVARMRPHSRQKWKMRRIDRSLCFLTAIYLLIPFGTWLISPFFSAGARDQASSPATGGTGEKTLTRNRYPGSCRSITEVGRQDGHVRDTVAWAGPDVPPITSVCLPISVTSGLRGTTHDAGASIAQKVKFISAKGG